MNDQTVNQIVVPENDPEKEKHKIIKKELLTIISIFVIMLVIVGVLEYFERTSGLVTKLSEQLVSRIL